MAIRGFRDLTAEQDLLAAALVGRDDATESERLAALEGRMKARAADAAIPDNAAAAPITFGRTRPGSKTGAKVLSDALKDDHYVPHRWR